MLCKSDGFGFVQTVLRKSLHIHIVCKVSSNHVHKPYWTEHTIGRVRILATLVDAICTNCLELMIYILSASAIAVLVAGRIHLF